MLNLLKSCERWFKQTGIWGILLSTLLWSQYAQAQTVTNTHPRLWYTPARMVRWQGYSKRNTLRWQKVKAAADQSLGSPTVLSAEYLPPLSIAYRVTGNKAYAQQAILIMMANALPTNTLPDDSFYNYRWCLPDMAFGYDWCYDQMSVAQRKQVATWLMDRADAIWPESNPARADGWGVASPGNNYFWGFMTTWSAALAVSGDGTDTGAGALSGNNRPQFHLQLALSKYRNLIRPFTDSWGQGGVFAESTNYDSAFQFSQILDAHLTATGQDLINETGFSFLHDSINWRIHSTVPTKDFYYNLGTQSRVPTGPTSEQDRQRGLIAIADTQDTVLASYGKNWLDTLNPSISNWWWITAWEFLYYNEEAPATDTKTMAPYYFASGPGILVRRSDWTPQATYWGIWAGILQESHQYFDVNGFLIYKGNNWLAGNGSMWSHSGTGQDTFYHNNLTFNGMGQGWQSPDNVWPNQAGVVLHQENTAEYTYFAGWGAEAYVQDRSHGGVGLATDYVRKVAYIAPDLFLVYDRAGLLDPTLPKEWHLHSQTPITINGRSYKFNNGQYQLVGQSLLPATGVTVQQTPMYLQDPLTPSSYRLDVVTNNKQATDYMLNVLQTAPVSQAAVLPTQVLTATTGNMEGAICGNWIVLFGKSDLVTGNVSYTTNANALTNHLLVDLLPNVAYKVTLTNLATNASSVLNPVASKEGSLRFSIAAGNYSVLLTPPAGATGTNPDPVFNPTGIRAANATAPAGGGNAGGGNAGSGNSGSGNLDITKYFNAGAGQTGGASGKVSAFVKSDAVTQGGWQGVYGQDGYSVLGNAMNYPAYAQVGETGAGGWIWAATSTDARALQKAGAATDRIAACAFQGASFTVDMNLKDGQTHQVALYCLDWDSAARSERIDVYDALTGTLLDSQTVSSFHNGVYMTWALSGHVQFKFTTLTGANAVLSGIYFDQWQKNKIASFVTTDIATQGNWKGKYGKDGYNVLNSAISYPGYAQVTASGQTPYTWAATSTDARALQKAGAATDRIAACAYAGTSFTVDVNLKDGQIHQVALHCLDWDSSARNERIDVYDVATGTLLDSQAVSNFHNGKYLIWNISGHVQFKVTKLAGANAVLSGIYFN